MEPPWIDGPAHWGDPEYETAMATDEIRRQISDLRAGLICEPDPCCGRRGCACEEAADTMENLLAVFEAADQLPTIYQDAGPEHMLLFEALEAVQTRQDDE